MIEVKYMNRQSLRRKERGAALVTALIFLVIITAIALSSMRSSTQELRMAVNAEEKVSAGQLAQALLDSVSSNPASTPVVGDVGRRVCTPLTAGNTPCDEYTLTLPAEVTTLMPAAERFVAVERLGAETRPCPRGMGMSLVGFGCAAFRVHSQYDGSAQRRSRADLNEGVLVAVPTS
ncbi:MAG TPA: PilX N-terminal domain-containing pilus assembly protein [Gammaproteobacteria bacterium]|nr:PilX N-terminal domain-containing pilus assembly protein [Gammaproteobacteria bacterium]